jgi:hypothetical protein
VLKPETPRSSVSLCLKATDRIRELVERLKLKVMVAGLNSKLSIYFMHYPTYVAPSILFWNSLSTDEKMGKGVRRVRPVAHAQWYFLDSYSP